MNTILFRTVVRVPVLIVLVGLFAAPGRGATVGWNTGSGTWDTSTANWTNSAGTPVAYTDGDDAVIQGIAAGSTVTLQAAGVAPASLTIAGPNCSIVGDNTSAEISSGSITVNQTSGTPAEVKFSGRGGAGQSWSFDGGATVTGGRMTYSMGSVPTGTYTQHFGTAAVTIASGIYRLEATYGSVYMHVDQDIVVDGDGTLESHYNQNRTLYICSASTLTLKNSGTFSLKDYAGGGNGGWATLGDSGAIVVDAGAGATRLIDLAQFSGNNPGFDLVAPFSVINGFDGRVQLRNQTGKLLRISGDNSSYVNGFQVIAGIGSVQFMNANALGSTAGGSTKILISENGYLGMKYAFAAADVSRIDAASSGTLGIDTSTSADIDLSATGINAPDLWIGGNDSATYTGTITPNGSVYRFQGAVSSIGSLRLGDGTAGTDNLLTGERSVLVGGNQNSGASSRLNLVLMNDNDYTGGTLVTNRGIVSMGCTGGTPFGSGQVVMHANAGIGAVGTAGSFHDGSSQFTNYYGYAGSFILLDENHSGNFSGSNGGNGRWGDAAPMSINGYLLTQAGKNNTYNETIGVVTFEQGSSLQFNDGGGTSRYLLDVDSLVRSGRATLFFANAALGSAGMGVAKRLRASSPPGLANGMLPPYYYDYGNKTFLTYNSSSDAQGVIGFAAVTYTITSGTALNTPPGASDVVYQSTADITLNNSPTMYALKTDRNISGSSYTVTVSSGGLILAAAKTHSANFSFGSAEGMVWLSGGNNTISGTVTGSDGLTKGGASTLYLSGDNSSTLSGQITVNQGMLSLNHATTLGPVHLCIGYGGSLDMNTQGTLNITNFCGEGRLLLDSGTLNVYGDVNPGSGAMGSLTVDEAGSVVLQSGASLTVALGPRSRLYDQLVIGAADIDISGVPVTVEDAGGLEAGTYTLIDTQGGSMTGTPGALTMPAGFSGSLQVSGDDLLLIASVGTRGTVFLLR